MPVIKETGSFESSAATRLTYREDDSNFKQRLNTMIQIGWVYNTSLTIIVCTLIFSYLGINLLRGVLLGILLALFANFRYTMVQVTHASRWEIYKNRFVMPKGLQGKESLIMFKDIKQIDRTNDMLGGKVVVDLSSGSKVTIRTDGQEHPIQVLMIAFNQYSNARSKRAAEIPISMGSDSLEPIEHEVSE